jgi:outer membrane protein assembly factor BamB
MRKVSRHGRLMIRGVLTAIGLLVMSGVTPAHAEAPGDWPQFMQTSSHQGWNRTESILNPSNVSGLQPVWTYAANSTVSSPVIADGAAFAVSGGTVISFEAMTGTVRWTFHPNGQIVGISEPTIDDDVLYFSADLANLPFQRCKGRVFALNPSTGATLWKTNSGCNRGLSITAADGALFLTSGNSLVSMDGRSGAVLWTFPTANNIDSSPTVSGGLVFSNTEDGNLYALDEATGAEVWRFPIGGGNSSADVTDGRVFIGSSDGNLYSLDEETGALQWSTRVGDYVYSTPAVAAGTLYVGSPDGYVIALAAATGTKRWAVPTGTVNVGVSASPAVANGLVYVGADTGVLYALDASSGAELWSFTDFSWSSAAVSNGKLYASSTNVYGPGNTLYAFGLP